MRFDAPRHLLGDLFSISPTPTTARLEGINNGTLGVKDTLAEMRNFARASVRDPQQIVRELTLSLVLNLPERDYGAEITALHAFVRDNIRYVQDPEDLELVATPEKTLEYRQGDCDDKSTLLAAMLTSINHPARFAAIGLNGQPFSHVLVETKIRNTGDDRRDWLPLETILKVPAGWWPDGVTSKYVMKI
jgi:transglutaminase-like putative cysteine protease